MTRDLILLVADRATGEVMEGGEPSGLVITRKATTFEMSYEGATVIERALSKDIEPKSYDVWEAMLSASRVDLTKAEVKLPERGRHS